MPVSKKRNRNKNSGPTKSKKLSSQMSDVSGPSPRWFVITMSSLMIVGVLLIVLNYLTLLPGSVSRWYLCLLYTSPSPRDGTKSRMPSSA